MIKLYSSMLFALSLLAIIGCDSGPPKYVVGGAVTLDGEPVTDGCVTFTPHEGGYELAATAPLIDGRYQLECVEGSAAVTITGFGPNQKLVPIHYYDTAAGLEATVLPEDGQTADFELSSKFQKFRRRR
ncbi:hypothetical protein [Blastopirellula marina]|uniref:Carboxypeptidase regulatory-like domain-containing protein n=1 Tax=Blastopirellula marina TaxID=124 RepID=A0A2S8GHW0_9BACT|nr:hypothetical protein [Blastopirellula marina]PQO44048.1 hypothetical protein C5Y93_21135 [Blastopirellula marina]